MNNIEFHKHINASRISSCYSGGYVELCLLVYNAVWSVHSQPVFRRNKSPPSSGLKSILRKKPDGSIRVLHVAHLLGL
jgi:hypothetical protein